MWVQCFALISLDQQKNWTEFAPPSPSKCECVCNLLNTEVHGLNTASWLRDATPSTLEFVHTFCLSSSGTRLGDLLHFGQFFKACGNNYFAQFAHIISNFCKGVEIFHFYSEIILGHLL